MKKALWYLRLYFAYLRSGRSDRMNLAREVIGFYRAGDFDPYYLDGYTPMQAVREDYSYA